MKTCLHQFFNRFCFRRPRIFVELFRANHPSHEKKCLNLIQECAKSRKLRVRLAKLKPQPSAQRACVFLRSKLYLLA